MIGRSLAFLSTLCGTGCLAWYLWNRHGRGAALVGALLSLGAAPLYGFSIMTRPDATADAAGLAGLLLTTAQGRRTAIAAGALLAIAILTKQTAGIYLAAALVMCLGNGTYAQAGWLSATAALVLASVSVVLSTSAPLFLVSIFQERRSPLSLTEWLTTMAQLVRLAPELLALTFAGIVLWIRQKNHGLALATGTLLAGSLLTALKIGADMNYFLPLRTASVVAAGSLWAVARDGPHRRQGWLTACRSCRPSGPGAQWRECCHGGARGPRPASVCLEPARRAAARDVRRADPAGAETGPAGAHRFRDSRALPEGPRAIRGSLAVSPARHDRSHSTGPDGAMARVRDLRCPRVDGRPPLSAYDSNSFALPPPLVERARAHYQLVAQTAGLFIYRPRRAS